LTPVALVTGAATRVGRAIAEELIAARFRVAIHYRASEEAAMALCDELRARGGVAHCFSADLSHRAEARNLVVRVIETFGTLDLLVANAAIFEQVRIGDITDTDWDRMLSVNLSSTVALAQHAVPELRARRGGIVIITCSSVEAPYRYHLPYIVSKAGVYQAMRAMALELAPDVRVNAVAPGTVLPPEEMDLAELERLRRRIPLQRFGAPQDIARAVRFLSESPFVTGQQIVVDGGRSLGLVPDGS
jgi:pteridine reductase